MRFSSALWGGALIAALASALYLPFLDNPLVFDDRFFASGLNFSRYATTPLGLELRLPAFFSLAAFEVLWGGIRGHRIVSLLLHVACALALYKLVLDLVRYTRAERRHERGDAIVAFGATAAFALHPVAVYAAGYLIQRSIVLATLFSLLSIILFARGLARRSHADAISAALFFSLAVLSKETAVLLPAAAVLVIALFPEGWRFGVRHAAIYLAACAPAALLAVLLSKGVIGKTYEPHFSVVANQVTQAGQGEAASHPWLTSVATQLETFFRYLGRWLWPDTAGMSVDLRVDFATSLLSPALLAFVAYAAISAVLLARGGRAAMAGFGLLYAWVLYFVEFSTVRFQEPFVLYRSYLWAPGLAIGLAAGLRALPSRALVVAIAAGLPLLALQATDRLRTFESGFTLWKDAAEKLPAHAIAGGSRPLYELGREYWYRGEHDKALETVERCMALYPETYDCHFARAAIHIELAQYEKALPHIARAIALRPRQGVARHHLGLILEKLGRLDEAREAYRLAAKLRFSGALQRLQRLDEPGKGLLAPASPPATER